MIRENFHTHTNYCDGKCTAEEMIRAALNNNFTALGFSGHAHMDFDPSWCMTEEGTLAYISEINSLKEKYKGKINIYCGTEVDYFCPELIGEYDYRIGSVHYLLENGEYLPVDGNIEEQKEAADKYYGGSLIEYAVHYFELTADVVRKTKADFIGHFDLVSKFNEGDRYFDTHDPRYVKAWKEAAKCLCETNKPFEINTGAMARKLRTSPYPTLEMAEFIHDNGGEFIVNSDCHYPEKLTVGFNEAEELYSRFGIHSFEEYLR